MKKLITLFALLVAALTLAGCSAPRTAEDPAIIGESTWEVEYIVIGNDSQAIPCLWNHKGGYAAVISCDWSAKTTEIPLDADRNVAGEDSWEIEYVSHNEKTIPCLWHSRDSQSAVMSCDFS